MEGRHASIEMQLRQLSNQFVSEKTLRVFAGTWNVNAKKPKETTDLRKWLYTSVSPQEAQFDLVAVGFQEIVELNASALVVDSKAYVPWIERMQGTLGNEYTLVAHKHLVGILLAVWVHRKHWAALRDTQFDTVGVGIMGVAGNKGAAAIRFDLYDSSICIVAAHLAAHQHNVMGRNSDYANIIARLKFGLPSTSIGNALDESDVAAVDENGVPLSRDIWQHDTILWLGDLNYRLDTKDFPAVLSAIERRDWAFLNELDQLNRQRQQGNAFVEFEEGAIDFPPTYKFTPGTDQYQQRDDKKRRVPAWCDRVLWTTQSPVTLLHYTDAPELRISDHKPVAALFECRVRRIDNEKRALLYEKLSKELDRWENAQTPSVKLDCSTLEFENVRFDMPISKKLVVTNDGNVVARFRIKQQRGKRRSLVETAAGIGGSGDLLDAGDPTALLLKPWFRAEPASGIVFPGEAMQLTVTCHVTTRRSAARQLLERGGALESTLVLSLDNGPDRFVSLGGHMLLSCFGAPLETLVKCTQPMRELARSESGVPVEAHKTLALPKELWRIVDWLYRRALEEPRVLLTPGIASEVAFVRECLDTGADFERGMPLGWMVGDPLESEQTRPLSPHSVGEVLVRFLESLDAPIFPVALCAQLPPEHASRQTELTQFCKAALHHLPLSHYNALVYLVCFLRLLLRRGKNIALDKLLSVFVPALMHSPSDNEDTRPLVVLRHFLTSSALSGGSPA